MTQIEESSSIPSSDNIAADKPVKPAEDLHPKQSSVFKVHYISPASTNLAFLAGKFSSLRLQALTISPESFGSKFKAVSKRTPSEWQAFLTRPNFHTFICSRYEADSEHPSSEYDIEQGQWVAHISLIGPTPKSAYDLYPPNGGDESGSDEQESKWHLTALWTDPTFRGQGIGKKLTEAAVDFTTSYEQGGSQPHSSAKQARVRLFNRGGKDNEHVLTMYRKMKFKDAGSVSLFEAMIGNGDQDEIPQDVMDAGNLEEDDNRNMVLKGGMWHLRYGVCMDRVIDCS